jgi:FxsC-like protein
LPHFYFFLSYARGDDAAYIERLFADLSAEVRSRAGLPANATVGFLDVNVQVGATWSSTLMAALATCATFVALVSPRYLLSLPCGREWTIFESRLHAMHQRRKPPPPALLPLLWEPPDDIPRVIADRQYQNKNMPAAYDRTGLRQIMRLKRHHDDYWVLLGELARQIVSIANQHPVPHGPEGVDYHKVRSAFTGAGTEVASAVSHGQVHFILAAPSRRDLDSAELANPPRDPRFYGEQANEWAPFRPGLDLPLAEYAQAIATERQFRATVTDIDGISDWFRDSADRDGIVVLLVDPWSTKLTAHRHALYQMTLFSNGYEPIGAVMVPANHHDHQTHEHLDELIDSLKTLLGWRGYSANFRSSVLSPQAFDADLQALLEAYSNHIFKTGSFLRRPPGRIGKRPILQGP